MGCHWYLGMKCKNKPKISPRGCSLLWVHPPALAWAPPQAAGGSLLLHELPWAAGESQDGHLLPAPCFTDLGACRAAALSSPQSSLCCCCTAEFPFLIPELLPPSLMASALARSGSVFQPAGIGCVGHKEPSGSFSQKTPLVPLATKLCHATPIHLFRLFTKMLP